MFLKNRGIAPVVGIILLVLITVIIAAVFWSFASVVPNEVQTEPKQVVMEAQQTDDKITIVHTGGDTIKSDELIIHGAEAIQLPTEIKPGDRIELKPNENTEEITVSVGDQEHSTTVKTIETTPTQQPTETEKPIHNIEQDNSYQKIQDAVNQAEKGDTIEIEPGIYKENIEITKSEITLKGTDQNDKPVIEPENDNHVLKINEKHDITLKNLEITNSQDRGIHAEKSDGIKIDNIKTNNNENDGIRVTETTNAQIVNSNSSNNDGDGITFYAYGEIKNNEIHNNEERGIFHAGSSAPGQGNITINDNNLSNNNFDSERAGGIIIYGGPDGNNTITATVKNNQVSDNEGNGILIYKVNHERGNDKPLYYDYNSNISHNTVTNTTPNDEENRGYGDGLVVYLSHNVDINNNEITDNKQHGIHITSNLTGQQYENTTNIDIIENNISDNDDCDIKIGPGINDYTIDID
ncbi:Secreted protein with PKD repeat domain [Methanonatronarchaeum thermophilum]|uniref:Secreted protein with PKD repeat domain n=1 Tax=Methanonatronarchaeum thermophilum TaxID=1927129 RepID=A0A1Y3GEG7_9EURY|nr:right-handed parallel beta-helix repeat-containing protein [Methanonatronarchaeum thermophilum]OUJ18584.1 Secreted protein with PKD repeat domain [Methanonatronarchaeum thermophilum]